jgi:hypothetical protein
MKKQLDTLKALIADVSAEKNQTAHLGMTGILLRQALASLETHVKKTAEVSAPAEVKPATA